MFTLTSSAQRLPAIALLIGSLFIPLGVAAQELPSYAQQAVVSTDETIHGRIASVDGAFNITVDDDRGFVDNVELHQGTIINPTGLSLSPGMSVTIAGYNAGSVFNANEIDTPYSYSGPLPTPVYYGEGYWCPGFAYGYGPAFSLAIIFGDFDGGDREHHGGYHYEHRPYYGRPWDGRRYFGSFTGHPDGGREVTGDRRVNGPPDAGERRTLPGDVRNSHAPSAFAGRSFAGDAYMGGTVRSAPGGPRAFAGTQYSPGALHYRAGGAGGYVRRAPVAGGFIRRAPVAGGFIRRAPVAGGFIRSAPVAGGYTGGGFARGGPAGGGFARSATPGGGFARSAAPGGGFARAGGGAHGAGRRE